MSKLAYFGGTGDIGEQAAALIGQFEVVDEIVLIGNTPGKAAMTAFDIKMGFRAASANTRIWGTEDYEAVQNADIILIGSGVTRNEDELRDCDRVLFTNAEVGMRIGHAIAKYAPEAFVVNYANPADEMTANVFKCSGLPAHRMVGLGGEVDSPRAAEYAGHKLHIPDDRIKIPVYGQHGPKMVLAFSKATVDGVLLPEYAPAFFEGENPDSKDVIKLTVAAGTAIQQGKGHSSTGGPAGALLAIARAFVQDKPKRLICSVEDPETPGVFLGQPVIVSGEGIKRDALIFTENERATYEDGRRSIVTNLARIDAHFSP